MYYFNVDTQKHTETHTQTNKLNTITIKNIHYSSIQFFIIFSRFFYPESDLWVTPPPPPNASWSYEDLESTGTYIDKNIPVHYS